MRRPRNLVTFVVASIASCAPTRRERTPQSVIVPRELAPETSAPLPVPDADAGVVSETDAAVLAAEERIPRHPPAPPKHQVSGDAALVWVPDAQAKLGIRSVLVQRAGSKARVVSQRKEPVLVGAKDLWVVREKKLSSKACAECDRCTTDPPSCHRDALVVIDEPYLLSLRSRQKLEPWSSSYGPRGGCSDGIGDHSIDFKLVGGVGGTYFVSIQSTDYYCGAAHPMFADESISFDIDTGNATTLSFPTEVSAVLVRDARAELVDGCIMDEKDEVTRYRARAEYSSSGELRGVYELTMPAPYVCGTGPDHYSAVSEQSSDWIPPELSEFGRLPAWLASYVASVDAKYAFMISSQRAPAARREMIR